MKRWNVDEWLRRQRLVTKACFHLAWINLVIAQFSALVLFVCYFMAGVFTQADVLDHAATFEAIAVYSITPMALCASFAFFIGVVTYILSQELRPPQQPQPEPEA